MNWLRVICGLGLVWGFASAAPRVWAQTPPPLTVEVAFAGAEQAQYKAADGSSLDIYLFGVSPASSEKPKPAIVFFHGSGWVQGWIVQFAPFARELAKSGLVVACADYRTQHSHGVKPPDAMADARLAVGWLRSQSKRFGIDPTRIAAGGASSGAQLALAAALSLGGGSAESQPNALVLCSAITDTTADGYPSGVSLFEGKAEQFAPRHHLRAGMPPALILHGEADAWVPVASVRRFADESRKWGNEVECVTFAGRGHAFFNAAAYRPGVRPEDFYTVVFLMERFFARLGWIAPPQRIGTDVQSESTP